MIRPFYVSRNEDDKGKATYTVVDYYLHRPICVMILDRDSTNELYADRIAKALNEMLHPEK